MVHPAPISPLDGGIRPNGSRAPSEGEVVESQTATEGSEAMERLPKGLQGCRDFPHLQMGMAEKAKGYRFMTLGACFTLRPIMKGWQLSVLDTDLSPTG